VLWHTRAQGGGALGAQRAHERERSG